MIKVIKKAFVVIGKEGSTLDLSLIHISNFLLFFGGDFFRTVKQEIKYHKTRRTWQNQNRSNWR